VFLGYRIKKTAPLLRCANVTFWNCTRLRHYASPPTFIEYLALFYKPFLMDFALD
jgi:hypothetical protein